MFENNMKGLKEDYKKNKMIEDVNHIDEINLNREIEKDLKEKQKKQI